MKPSDLGELTSINFATNTKNCLADACADYGAVLGLVIDNLIFSVLDMIAGRLPPRCRECGESLEFVTFKLRCQLQQPWQY